MGGTVFSELALVEQSRYVTQSLLWLVPAVGRIRWRSASERTAVSCLPHAINWDCIVTTDSWSGEHPQTVLLPLSDPAKLATNLGPGGPTC